MIYAQYTEVLINIMDNEQTRPKLDKAMSTYPMYEKQSKEEYIPSYVPTREELNKKILNAYKYREIGFETVGRFLDELEISLNEIMPRYNLLFFSADQDFNIIYNVDYQRTIDTHRTGTESNTVNGSDTRTDNETMSGSSTSKTDTETAGTDKTTTSSQLQNDSKKVHSATPQGVLNIPSKNIESVNYADDVEWNQTSGSDSGTSNGETSGTSSSESSGSNEGQSQKTSEGSNESTMNGENEGTENTLETTKGNFGVVSAQDLILKYRETILNIEQMIIYDERISELFMRVF